MIKVLIADDQSSVRSALKLVLEQNGMSVAGEVVNGDELLERFKTNEVDLVLVDWELPGKPVSRIIPGLYSLSPGLSIIVLNSRPQTRRAALAAGAHGFVCKGDEPEHLLQAINSVSGKDVTAAGNPEKEIPQRRRK